MAMASLSIYFRLRYKTIRKMKKCAILLIIVLFAAYFSFSQSNVTFQVDGLPLDSMQMTGIRGSVPPLDWGKSIPLIEESGIHQITLEFKELDQPLEFKFVRYNIDNEPTWEKTQNRTLELVPGSNLISENQWNKEQLVDISTLKILTPKELSQDFELIKTMVLEVHPGTYRYNNNTQIETALAELKNKFLQPQTYAEAYLAISKLTAQLKCDHTKAGFNNQGKTINAIIHYQKDKIPFTFKWVEGQMIVIYNASENEHLSRGTAVLKINDIDVDVIQSKMMNYIGADGATDGNRLYKTEVNGYDFRYNAFDIFFPLLYPLKKDSLTLEIKKHGVEETQIVRVSTMTREERAKLLIEKYSDFPKSKDDLWDFQIIENKIGLVTINSFGLFGWKPLTIDYKLFLKEAFKKLKDKKIRHLIIDIRENTGGMDEMANELFSYLAKSYVEMEREGRTRYREFPESLKPFVQTWGDDPWYYNLKPKDQEPTDVYYIFKEFFKSKKSKNRNKKFKGNVYLLTSAANTSLAFYTAYRFQKQRIGLLIGQETGGNLNDINGGQILFLRLPHSKIEIDFPVMGGFTTNKQPDMGVKPTIEVNYSVNDIIEKRDVEIETLLKLIK